MNPTADATANSVSGVNLEPLDEKPTVHNIAASLEGDNFKSATAYATAPDGTQYAVCTTIQYGYKPSSNSASLTVEPPKTDVTAPDGSEPPTQSPEGTTVTLPPPKTPEQLQREAEQSGWLTTWHEFSWWYPRYRLHIKIQVNPTKQKRFSHT